MTDHIPDPTAMSGTLETTNTGGGDHERLSGVTRVFHHAEAVARNLINEIRHHGEHAATQPVSQVAEDTVPDAPEQILSDSDAEGQEGPQEPRATPDDTEPSTESQDAEETPAEDAPAATKTPRKRAAAKTAPDAPAEAAQ